MFANPLLSQTSCDQWAFGADFDMMNPIKELKTNGYGMNFGVNFDAFYLGFKRKLIGFHPGFRIRGGTTAMNSRDEFIGEPINQDVVRGIYNAAFDAKIIGRFILNNAYRCQPYMEADMGIRLAGGYEDVETSEFEVREEDRLDYTEYITKGISGSYGFGAGLLIRLTDRMDLNLRSNFDFTNLIKHVDFNTVFPFAETRTTSSINQRFAIGLFIHVGCEPAERGTKTKNRIRSNTKNNRNKMPKRNSSNANSPRINS